VEVIHWVAARQDLHAGPLSPLALTYWDNLSELLSHHVAAVLDY
jgi:hypothetical protein